MTEEEELKKVYERTARRVPDLVICRVPKKTLEGFRELAKEYCDDYGMALKFLYDNTFGALPQILSDYEARINALEHKLSLLGGEGEKIEEKKVIKMNDGSIIEVKKSE
jgi:hypothetical protein